MFIFLASFGKKCSSKISPSNVPIRHTVRDKVYAVNFGARDGI